MVVKVVRNILTNLIRIDLAVCVAMVGADEMCIDFMIRRGLLAQVLEIVGVLAVYIIDTMRHDNHLLIGIVVSIIFGRGEVINRY